MSERLQTPPVSRVMWASLGYAPVLSRKHCSKPATLFNLRVREVGAGNHAPQPLNGKTYA
jgi:hypothetical protein